MKKINFNQRAKAFVIAALALTSLAGAASAAKAQTIPLLPDGLVVSLYGDASTPETTSNGTATSYADGNATPISLEEFAPVISANVDSTVPALVTESLPDAGTGANVGIVGEYGSSSEGTIQLSGNGQYLTIGGYDGNADEVGAPAGGYGAGTAEAQSTDSNVPRVAAVINIATGSVDTSTVLNDIYTTNNPRSVYTANGSSIYISGQGAGANDEGGIYTAPVGDNTTPANSGNALTANNSAPTPIFNTVSTRTVLQYNGNTYYSADQNSSSKGTLTGIFEYAGSPTSSMAKNSGTLITPANNGLSGSALVNYSPEGFFFANSSTLYVADTGDPKAGGTGDGGIQKWSLSSTTSTWTLDYTLTSPNFVPPAQATLKTTTSGETGFEAITGQVLANGTVDLYAVSYTAGDDNPDGLYGVADTLADTTASQAANESVVELAKSSADSDFKGVAFIPVAAPEPSTWAMMLVGCLGLVWQVRRRLQLK